MTGDLKFFRKLDGTGKEEVHLADGSEPAGIGECFLNCVDGTGEVNKLTVKDVLDVPGLKRRSGSLCRRY